MTDIITFIVLILLIFVMGCLTGVIVHQIRIDELLDDATKTEASAYSRGFNEGYKLGCEKQVEDNNDR